MKSLFAITLMGPAMAWVQAAANPPAEAQRATNPCGASKPANPCAVRPTTKLANPCGAITPKPANPCGAVASGAQVPSLWLLRMMSLMAHLVYGAVMGSLYRRTL